jgi:hypothetical protein
LTTKITQSGVLYIPKTIREAFSREMKIIPNSFAALFFPADSNLEDVLASLKIIKADIEHKITVTRRNEQPKA